MSRLLVVDAEETFARLVIARLGGEHTVELARNADHALERLDTAAYDTVLTDLDRPPGPEGILRLARARGHEVPFIVLTGQGSVESALDAMRVGAFDYLRKTAGADELRTAVRRAIDHGRMQREVQRLRGEVAEARGVERPVGSSARMREVLALVDRVAPSDATILVLGEPGTGKERLARLLHRQSLRHEQPFVPVDCSALAPGTLFGHERGAFAGADRARLGLFREAHGGTLFLDEIGALAPAVQDELLRVLQAREVQPVGGDTFVKIDVRIIAATHEDLRELVQRGRFREDLFDRVAGVPIELPPLRERASDLPQLVASLLRRRRSAGPRPVEASVEALQRLALYRWPGNLRELENVIERAAILSDGEVLHERDLPPLGLEAEATAGDQLPAPDLERSLKDQLAEVVQRVERRAIVAALRAELGSPTRAARRLGISRASLYNKLKELEINV